MSNQVPDVGLPAGKKIIDANHFVAPTDQPIAQMASQKSGTARDDNRVHELRDSSIRHDDLD
jgi:hypothetical protein